MATLNDRIKRINSYFKGFNIGNDTSFVLVNFPITWKIFDEKYLNVTYKVYVYTKDNFDDIDKYLSYQLKSIEAESFSIVNLRDKNGKVFGSLISISKNEHIDRAEMVICAKKVENVFKQFSSGEGRDSI